MGHAEEITEPTLEIIELPAKIYVQALKEVIESHFKTSQDNCEVKISAGSEKGDNYIGVLYRVNVKYLKDELSIIVKLPPQSLARREQFFARSCFVRESEFYEKIFPRFLKFQEDKGIEVAIDGFYHVAQCYKSLTDDPYEGLMLEDLKVCEFEMFDRFKEVTADHVNLVMKALGKFHAISFAMKDQKPELIEEYRSMQDIFFQRDDTSKEQIRIWFDMLKKQATDVLENCDNQDLVKRARKVLEADFFELLMSCIDGPATEPYAVLCHGDCWNNNIMYRYENGTPVETRLLDWQIMRYASPICDLTYYIFGCTTKNLRDKHYKEFMNVYYESLSDFLIKLGSDPTIAYPREAFEDHLLRFGKFGLVMAVMCLPIFTSKAEDIPDMDEMAEKLQDVLQSGEKLDESEMQFTSKNTIGAYNERMMGVFQDVYDLNYI